MSGKVCPISVNPIRGQIEQYSAYHIKVKAVANQTNPIKILILNLFLNKCHRFSLDGILKKQCAE